MTIEVASRFMQSPGGVLVLAGLPGCGKSTAARSICAATGAIWDAIGYRATWQQRQAATCRRAEIAVEEALQRGESVVVDSAAVSLDERARWLRLAAGAGRPSWCLWWAPDLNVSLERRAHLADLVHRLAAAWCAPTAAEGFDSVMEARN